MSTLTQSSLDAALNKLRQENENAISALRNELKKEVRSMEDTIANAVIKAIKSSSPMDQMITDHSDNDATSMGSSNQYTIATMQTFADQIESLKNMVTMLTERVVEIAEKQEESANKLSRPPATPPKFFLPPEINRKQSDQSPLTKVPRAKGVTTPTKPSPKGSPTDGARAGQ
jgi:septal ring factor EnvC (AmiA/AmiB activator)